MPVPPIERKIKFKRKGNQYNRDNLILQSSAPDPDELALFFIPPAARPSARHPPTSSEKPS